MIALMMKRPLLFLLAAAAAVQARPEAFEVTASRLGELPQGKEADGIVGDFVLRNDVVVATISGNLVNRRANMSTFYGADGITPGCLYDLTFKDAMNDQLTIFCPCSQKGAVSWVRIVKDGSDGEAVIETVVTAAVGGGVSRRHTYTLRDGEALVHIRTELKNEGDQKVTVTTADKWTNFTKIGQAGKIRWADAIDPADHAGYAAQDMPNESTLAPGKEKVLTRELAVGHSPAEAYGRILPGGKPTTFTLTAADGTPVDHAVVQLAFGTDEEVPAYPDAQGRITTALVAPVQATVQDAGRDAVRFTLNPGESPTLPPLPAQSAVTFDIKDEQGRSTPCKAQFLALDGTPTPVLGPMQRAHGCLDQWHSETGSFRVPLPRGKYRVVVTRGIEFSHLEQEIDLAEGKTASISGILKRQVDTIGYISADFHNHSTPSGDNTCGTLDRLINLAAEHIEFAPTTEHNRLFDWAPFIEKLGLSPWLSTVSGLECTGGGQHLNSFPFTPEPGKQDNGAPVWVNDPRITAITLRDWQKPDPDRYIQVNHPDMEQDFNDKNKDGLADGGFVGVGQYVDCWEIENFIDEGILASEPWRLESVKGSALAKRVKYIREFIWLQLLNQGHRLRSIAVADAHTVWGNGVGGWRCYFASATDDPAKIDWRAISREAKSGHTVMTTAPFLTVSCGAARPGDEITSQDGKVSLAVKVQCPDWTTIDRVQVLVNGRQDPKYNFTRASHPQFFTASGPVVFDQVLPVELTADAHLIVVAINEHATMETLYGSSAQGKMRPCAYHNPIYIDVRGDGWKPNHDTLGHEIPVANLSVDAVRKLLGM